MVLKIVRVEAEPQEWWQKATQEAIRIESTQIKVLVMARKGGWT
jgi:hypothetical protein